MTLTEAIATHARNLSIETSRALARLTRGQMEALLICLAGNGMRYAENSRWQPLRGTRTVTSLVIRDLARDGMIEIAERRPARDVTIKTAALTELGEQCALALAKPMTIARP